MSVTLRYDLECAVKAAMPELERLLGQAELYVREGEGDKTVAALVRVLETRVIHETRPVEAPSSPSSPPVRTPVDCICVECEQVIPRGEKAVWTRNRGMSHPVCPEQG